MKRHYLAFDLGAESGRAMLAQLDDQKELKLQEIHRFPNTPVFLPSGLYWDTLHLFQEICDGLRAAGRALERIDSIGIDTWGVDFGLLGEDGALIENPRHYRDSRTAGVAETLFQAVPKQRIFQQTGIQFMDINSLVQLWAIHRTAPGLLGHAAKLLFMPDLFNYFLTGAYGSERTIASTSQFYDPVKRAFATDMLRELGISASFFAELIEPGQQLGPVLPTLIENTGLSYAPQVTAVGSHDTASAVAAAPVRDDVPWCYISSGTWSLVGVELDAPILTDSAFAANFTNEIGVERTVRFLKNVAGLWILQECRRDWARQGHDYSYASLMEQAHAAKRIEAVIDPDDFVAPGRYVGKVRQYCRTTGQQVPESVGEVCLVILRSLAVRYREVIGTLEQITGKRIGTIHIVGGGAQNTLLNQLTADETGRRVVAGPVEATAAGNALMQALGAGQIENLQELRAIVSRSLTTHVFEPA